MTYFRETRDTKNAVRERVKLVKFDLKKPVTRYNSKTICEGHLNSKNVLLHAIFRLYLFIVYNVIYSLSHPN
jgi:hypothetical protein